MISNVFSSNSSNAQQSLPPTNSSHPPFTPTISLRYHEMNNKSAIGRIFGGYSFAFSNGIKPVPAPFTNKFIHTRIETGHERLINMSKALERTKCKLKVSRRLRQRQKKIAQITEQSSAHLRLIEIEEHNEELKNMTEKVEHWRTIAKQHEDILFKVGEDVLTLTGAALTSARNLETLRTERDEIRAELTREKEHAEWTEYRRELSVSRLRQRWELEKKYLQEEVDELRLKLCTRDRKIAELNEFCAGSVKEMKGKERHLALHESSKAMESAKDFEALRDERDEIRALLAREKERAEETERHCNETVSSLRQISEHEKELLKRELEDLRQNVCNKDQKIAELNEFCEESMQEMEHKDRQIALHESNEVMDSFSRGMSCILSEMSEVVLFGQKDWPNLGEKMEALCNGVKVIVCEVKSRRQEMHRAM